MLSVFSSKSRQEILILKMLNYSFKYGSYYDTCIVGMSWQGGEPIHVNRLFRMLKRCVVVDVDVFIGTNDAK